MDTNATIISIHEDLIDFGSELQSASAKKLGASNHIGNCVYTALYKMCAYAITLHRAVLSLCEAGWTPITAILLRTIMECTANCLAIVNNACPEYMAFKYLYHPYLQIIRDTGYPEDKKKKAKIDLEQGLKNLLDEMVRENAKRYIESDRIDIFWFKPEEAGVSKIINNYGNTELNFLYGALSMSAHAGHLGMFLFKDDPDEIVINPSDNPEKEKTSLIASCRLLLELLLIRNDYEDLGFDSSNDSFMERILATE